MTLEGSEAELAVDALVELLEKEKSYLARCWICLSLSRFPDSRKALNALLGALKDPHSDVKAMAVISLGLLGETAVAGDIKTHISRQKGTPVGFAGFAGLGLLRNPDLTSYFLMDFEFASSPQEYEAMSFGLGKTLRDNQVELLFRLVESKDFFTREYAIRTLGMVEGLSEVERRKVIALLSDYPETIRKKDRSFKEDSINRFYASIIRAAMGDRSAVKDAMEAMRQKDFYLKQMNEMDWTVLMDPINDELPTYYRIKPFFWSDTD
jgi:HEAT repeat protein